MDKKVTDFKLANAIAIAEDFLNYTHDLYSSFVICGSIRRMVPTVHDVDLVVIPKTRFLFSSQLQSKIFKSKQDGKSIKKIREGAKIIELSYECDKNAGSPIQIDLNIANKETFEVLKLIKTGSAMHNVKLCTIAKERGWKLKVSGEGLYDKKDQLVANTENGILFELLAKIPPPDERF